MSSTVLVVDDSLTTRFQVRRALEAAGYSIVEAVDGVEGFEKLGERADISFILCDIMMPRMSGIEFLEQLGAVGKIAIPVLLFTTDAQPELIRRAKILGAHGWIVKPFKPELLVAMVRKFDTANGPMAKAV